eukprot:4542704-Amphidinium_carterae.1
MHSQHCSAAALRVAPGLTHHLEVTFTSMVHTRRPRRRHEQRDARPAKQPQPHHTMAQMCTQHTQAAVFTTSAKVMGFLSADITNRANVAPTSKASF